MNRPKTTSLLALLTLLVLLGTALPASAYDFIYNNQRFKILDRNARTVEVTQMDPATTNGGWYIADHPVYNGVTYTTVAIGDSAFYNCAGMTSMTIPNTVTRIGNYAFKGCTKLREYTMPNAVTYIGHYAFSTCNSLKSVEVPATVTSVGNGVFNSCDSLNSVTMNAKLTTIPMYMFYQCRSLDDIKVPHTVTSIGYCAMAYCALDRIILPYGLKSIGDAAFLGNTRMTTVLIPSSVTSIASAAFNGCTALTDVYCNMRYPEDVTFSGVSPNCKAYTPVASLSLYQAKAGWNQMSLQEGAYDFNYGYNFNPTTVYHMTITSDQPVVYNGVTYDGTAKYVYHPCVENATGTFQTDTKETDNMCGSGKRYLMTEMGDKCLYNSAFTKVPMGDQITRIDYDAFMNCRSLPSVTLPANLTYIGTQAFYGCSQLTSIVIPNSVTTVDFDAFHGCTRLDTVRWSEGCDVIPQGCFAQCNMGHFTMPHWVKRIDDRAFASTSLSGNLILPYGLKTIGNNAFSGVNGISTALVPSSVTSLGYSAFNNCSGLNTLICNMDAPTANMNFTNVPSSCKIYVPVGRVQQYKNAWSGRTSSIEAGAFDFNYGYSGYAYNAVYHMTITSDQPVTFNGTTYDGTAKYVFHPNIKSCSSFAPTVYEPDFMCGSGKRYLITEVGDSAFYYAFNSTNTTGTQPSLSFAPCGGLTKIGHDAFWLCQAKELTLPSSVTTYDNWALYKMPNMTDLWVYNPTPVSIMRTVFHGDNYDQTTLHVPTQAALSAYRQADVWKNFYNITTEEELEMYEIYICDTQVTNVNMNNITGDGISGHVSYDPQSRMLVLDHASIGIPNHNAIIIGEENVTIKVVGTDNYIGTPTDSVQNGIVSNYDITITGNGYDNSKLSIYANYSDILFGIVRCNGSTISNVSLALHSREFANIEGPATDMFNTTGTLIIRMAHIEFEPSRHNGYYPISYLRDVILEGCYIALPYNGSWDSSQSGIVDSRGNLVVDTPALIEVNDVVRYGVDVCGIPVTNANCNGITGPGIDGTVWYSPSSNLLVLEGATLTSDNTAIDFYNEKAAYLYFNGHNNYIGTEDNPVYGGIRCNGEFLNIEGYTSRHTDNSLHIYAEQSPVMHQSVINDGVTVSRTTLADGSFYLNGLITMWGGGGYQPSATFHNVYAEIIPEGTYYQFQWYQYMDFSQCYIAEPEGGFWKSVDETPADREFGWICTADGRAWPGNIVIMNGEAPVTVTRGDVDGSGNVDPADIAALINYLLGGTWPNGINAPARVMAPANDKAFGVLEMPAKASASVQEHKARPVLDLPDMTPKQQPQPRQQAVTEEFDKTAPVEAPGTTVLPDPKAV